MRTNIVIGNWKMNGDRVSNSKLLGRLEKELFIQDSCTVVVCPPFPFLQQAADGLPGQKVKIGAQNVSSNNYGAHTGEVCAQMLIELGCSYVLLGHSERRTNNHESDSDIAAKFSATIESGLTPVLCVGETLEQKNAGLTQSVVTGQISSVIEQLGISAFKKAIIAYEPIWAIGTGETATPEQAQAVHQIIRELLNSYDSALADNVSILYGGSVNASNAAALFSQIDIDGALVGGASLDADQFISICNAAT
jgi:triosephosphate isomerase